MVMDYGYEIPSLDLFKKITKNEAKINIIICMFSKSKINIII